MNWRLFFFLLLVMGWGVLSVADTPGAFPFPSSDEAGGELSWEGFLEAGKLKEITVIVQDESYLHWTGGEDSGSPVAIFAVRHSGTPDWETVIQEFSTETESLGPWVIEKTQISLRAQEGKWLGAVHIVPSASVESIAVLKSAEWLSGSFGVWTVITTPDQTNPQRMERAGQIHEKAWSETVNKAATDKYYKYAIYASRTLSVKHPEIYLRGDGLFLEHITTTPGFAEAYERRNPYDDWFEQQYWLGPSFNLGQINLAALEVASAKDLYSEDAPFHLFLDRRVLPIASCLKTVDNRVTPLEKAFLLYFLIKEERDELPFLIYCDNGMTYLATKTSLLDVVTGSDIDTVDGDPVLIFNEQAVWYPLMERDDTGIDSSLQEVVDRYRKEKSVPVLSYFEQLIIDKLRAVTTLEGELKENLAALAAMRGNPFTMGFPSEWRACLTDYSSDIGYLLEDNWVHRANLLSPLTAHLAAIIGPSDLATGVGQMVDTWRRCYGCRWGCIWKSSLVKYSIDEMMRIRYGHCVLQANCISSVLDLAGIKNVVFQAGVDVPSYPNHTVVSIPELGYVISNGDLTDRNTVLNHLVRAPDTCFNTPRYIVSGDLWAVPFLGAYCGNWPPAALANEVEHLAGLYGDEINGWRLPNTRKGTVFAWWGSLIPSNEFIVALRNEQTEWEPFQHP
jgi:hypothetical protein